MKRALIGLALLAALTACQGESKTTVTHGSDGGMTQSVETPAPAQAPAADEITATATVEDSDGDVARYDVSVSKPQRLSDIMPDTPNCADSYANLMAGATDRAMAVRVRFTNTLLSSMPLKKNVSFMYKAYGTLVDGRDEFSVFEIARYDDEDKCESGSGMVSATFDLQPQQSDSFEIVYVDPKAITPKNQNGDTRLLRSLGLTVLGMPQIHDGKDWTGSSVVKCDTLSRITFGSKEC